MKRDNSIKENKKRKQSIKDLRKVVNKKCKKNEDMSKRNNETNPIPNIKDIPKAGDVLHVVPGDGSCVPNCATSYLFHNEVFSPELRRRMIFFHGKSLEYSLQIYYPVFSWASLC